MNTTLKAVIAGAGLLLVLAACEDKPSMRQDRPTKPTGTQKSTLEGTFCSFEGQEKRDIMSGTNLVCVLDPALGQVWKRR